MNKKLILVITISIIAFFSFYSYKKNDSLSEDNRTENETFVAIGVYDEQYNIIDNGSNLKIDSKNLTLNHTFDLSQNVDENRDYLLISMVDFKQTSFKIDGKSHSSYNFHVGKSDAIVFDIEIDIPENSHELSYIIIKNPNTIPNDKDYKEMISAQTIMSSRFSLQDSKVSTISYESSVHKSKKEPYDYIWISENKDELNPINIVSKENPLYLTIGNIHDEDINYAVVLFSNWEQVKFDNDLVKYFDVNAQSKQVFELDLNEFNSDTIYQAIAFPMPYDLNKDSIIKISSFGSFKFTIED